MAHILIVSNNIDYFYLENRASMLFTYDTIHTIPIMDINEVTWEAGDTTLERCILTFDIESNGTIQNVTLTESIFDRVTNVIETCIFLNKINVVTTISNSEVFKGWLPDIVEIVDIEPYRVEPIKNQNPIVFSNVIWSNVQQYFRPIPCMQYINIALTVEDNSWKTITKQKLKTIRSYWNSHGIEILSINGLFYNRNCNLFKDFHNFVCHFKLVLDYACILGCTYVIYGSPESKSLEFSMIDKYETYQEAHQTFIRTMRGLADYAKTRKIVIVIKPNERSNYLCDQENAEEMVTAINHTHVQVGKKRQHIFTQFNGFNLVEFQGNMHALTLLNHKITLSQLT